MNKSEETELSALAEQSEWAKDVRSSRRDDEGTRGGPTTLDELSLNLQSRKIFHSDRYLVVDKPPDVRLDGDFEVTLEKVLLRDYAQHDKFRWIHQLDFATSGVLCIGLTKKATIHASLLFEQKLVQKEYLAIVRGHMPFEPPADCKSCHLSEVAMIVRKNQEAFVEERKGTPGRHCQKRKVPRLAIDLFRMEKNNINHKKRKGQMLTADEEDLLLQSWRSLSKDIKKQYEEKYEKQLSEVITNQHSKLDSSMNSKQLTVPSKIRGYIFEEAIAPCRGHDFRMEISSVGNPGKKSATVAFVLGHGHIQDIPVTKVLLRPLSGRRHQLRLHLSNHGYPIVGDATYGVATDVAKVDRMMLHAWRLEFMYPPELDNAQQEILSRFEAKDPFIDYVNNSIDMTTFLPYNEFPFVY